MRIRLSFRNNMGLAAPVAAACCLGTLPGGCLAHDVVVKAVVPVLRAADKPAYPPHALLRGASGEVTLQFIIDAHGQPRCIEVVEATAPQLFAHTAIAAVRRWRYQPPRIDGRPADVPVRLVMRFAYD